MDEKELGDPQREEGNWRAELESKVGRIVLAGANCEWIIYEIARAIRLGSLRKLSASKARIATRKRILEVGVPPWSAVTAADVIAWLDRVALSLNGRNSVVHASYNRVIWDGERWIPAFYSIRDDRMRPEYTPPLGDLEESIRANLDEGMLVIQGLWLADSGSGPWSQVYDDAGNVRHGVEARCDGDSWPSANSRP